MKTETLSQKGFELDPNSLNYNTAYYKEDVKEFIKEILKEIKKRNVEGYYDHMCYEDFEEIIKQKAGKELVEND